LGGKTLLKNPPREKHRGGLKDPRGYKGGELGGPPGGCVTPKERGSGRSHHEGSRAKREPRMWWKPHRFPQGDPPGNALGEGSFII